MSTKILIRAIIYILRTILWSPVIILGLLVTPIVWLVLLKRAGMSTKESLKAWGRKLMEGIRYDMYVIRTGKWY